MDTKQLLESVGLNPTRLYRTNSKNDIFYVSNNGDRYIAKVTENPQTRDNIRTEVQANLYMQKLEVKVPNSQLIDGDDYTIGVFEILGDKPIVNQGVTFNQSLSDQKLDSIIDVNTALSTAKFMQIPEFFKKRATIYNAKSAMNRVQPILERLNLPSEQKGQVLKMLETAKYSHNFNQHDFVLWNMFARGDKIAICDSEYARWGPAWYDTAYFFVQTYTYLENPDLAKRYLKKSLARLSQTKQGANIAEQIKHPLLIRTLINLDEIKGDKKSSLAKILFKKVLKDDIRHVLE